ncbi:MAG TPA: hypothetical protein VJ736_11390 [Actinomycetota bacterium]|nr:hypothetical protein [Actinomycetota bacterium]
MDRPSTCPECRSDEIRETTRSIGIYGDVTAFICSVCDWSSDLRIGRPPADRSKNITLRRLIDDSQTDATEPS